MRRLKTKGDALRLQPQDTDDLWVLQRLISAGMTVGMLGERRDPTTAGVEGGRAKAAERKRMWIELQAERSEGQAFAEVLRVHGIITSAKFDVGLHHTHLVGPLDEVELTPLGPWSEEDRALLKDALDDTGKRRMGLVVVEADEVLLWELGRHALREVHQFTMRGGGKRTSAGSSVRKAFLKDVARRMLDVWSEPMPLLLCGPGSTRDQLAAEVKALGAPHPLRSVAASTGGTAALHEVMADGEDDAWLSDHALARQARLVGVALERMATDGAVAYGPADLWRAAEEGGVEVALVLADHLRTEGAMLGDRPLLAWVEAVRAGGGELLQCSLDDESGDQLNGFGGVLGLLRWRQR